MLPLKNLKEQIPHFMHNKPLYLLGASGHAKVILESLAASGKKAEALFDDNPAIKNLLGLEVIGLIKDAMNITGAGFIISIGNNKIRKRVAGLGNFQYEVAVHPGAIISPTCTIETGTVIMAGAVVNAETNIGKHVILNTRCSVDHDCVLGDFVHISPGATLAGNVKVGEGTHVGTNACIIPGITIGKWATIGAGAVIIRNVPDHAVVVGNPGRVIRIEA
jgi:sugar O-acyltransferase (sialic acid O-acetyltransferase NeuD family)